MFNSNFENQEDPLMRPKSINDFVGQGNIINNLSIFLKAALERNEPLDHVLLYGPPGLGKTTLAQIISHEMKADFKITSGPLLTKTGDLASILTNTKANDILFIDEIHRLNNNIEELLYPAMEDYCIDIIVGSGPAAKTLRLDLPKFTLVGATTRYGLLSNPLRDRFGITFRLQLYSAQELCNLIESASYKMNLKLTRDGIKEIAKRSRGTPRIALRLTRRIRDFAQTSDIEVIDKDFTSNVLQKLGIDYLGLNQLDYSYLKFIAINYKNSPVGLDTISAALLEKKDSIEETVEPYLMQIGFLNRTKRGRLLTQQAIDHIKVNNPSTFIV